MTPGIITISGSGGIQGNISNCEIQTVKTNTNYTPFRWTYTDTYQVINKCDNSVLSTYNEGGAGFWIWFLVILAILVIVGIVSKDED